MPIPVPEGFSDAQEGFEPLPSGKYLVEVTGAEEKLSGPDAKTPGMPYIAFEFTIQDEEYDGRRVWMNCSFSPKAMGMTKQSLRALGGTDEEFATEINPEDYLGRQGYAIVTEGTNPKTKEKNNSVKRVLPLSEEDSELPG